MSFTSAGLPHHVSHEEREACFMAYSHKISKLNNKPNYLPNWAKKVVMAAMETVV